MTVASRAARRPSSCGCRPAAASLRATVRRVRTLADGRFDFGLEFVEGQDRAIGRMAVELFGGTVPDDSSGWERVAA